MSRTVTVRETATGKPVGPAITVEDAYELALLAGDARGLRSIAIGKGGRDLVIDDEVIVPPPPPPDPDASIPHVDPPTGWRSHFSDSFGSGLDRSVWVGMDRKFGQTMRPLVNLNENAYIEGGNLILAGTRLATPEPMSNGGLAKYGCGGVWTRGASGLEIPRDHHGRIVFQTGHGQGYWSAPGWLRDTASAQSAGGCELDVHESFDVHIPHHATSAVFCDPEGSYLRKVAGVQSGYATGRPPGAPIFVLDDPADPNRSDVFAFDWRCSVGTSGGRRFQTWSNARVLLDYTESARLAWASRGNPQAFWDLLINLQLGGDWVGDPDGPYGYLPGPARTYATAGLHRIGYKAGADAPDKRAKLPNTQLRIHSVEIWAA